MSSHHLLETLAVCDHFEATNPQYNTRYENCCVTYSINTSEDVKEAVFNRLFISENYYSVKKNNPDSELIVSLAVFEDHSAICMAGFKGSSGEIVYPVNGKMHSRSLDTAEAKMMIDLINKNGTSVEKDIAKALKSGTLELNAGNEDELKNKFMIWNNHIILEDWKNFIEEELMSDYEKRNGQAYEGTVEDFLKQYPVMCETKINQLNDLYLRDEKANLCVSTNMVVRISVADNFGQVSISVKPMRANLNGVLPKFDQYEQKPLDYEDIKGEFFVEKSCGILEIRGIEQGKMGESQYLFREMRPEYSNSLGIEKLENSLLGGNLTMAELDKYTMPLGDMVWQIYGFNKDRYADQPSFFETVKYLTKEINFEHNRKDLDLCK